MICREISGLRSAVALLTLLSAGAVRAALVTFNFGGTTTSATTDLSGVGITPGMSFSGQISYDTTESSTDELPLLSDSGRYKFSSGSSLVYSVTVAGHTFSNDQSQGGNLIFTYDNTGGGDGLAYRFYSSIFDGGALPGAPSVTLAALVLDDNFIKLALDSDALPATAPNLASFPDLKLFQVEGYDSTKELIWRLNGTVENITAVPEPSTTSTIAAVVLFAFSLISRSRVGETGRAELNRP